MLCQVEGQLVRITHSVLTISAKKLDVFEFRNSAFKCACNSYSKIDQALLERHAVSFRKVSIT